MISIWDHTKTNGGPRIYADNSIESVEARRKAWVKWTLATYYKHPEREKQRHRETYAKILSEDPDYEKKRYRKDAENLRFKKRKSYNNTRERVIEFLGGNCFVLDCQINEYPIELKIIALSPHHLNGVDSSTKRIKSGGRQLWAEYREILSGKETEVDLLCGSHHAIADKLGKDKWITWLCRHNIKVLA